MSAPAKKERHHWVPRCYLKRFAVENKLQVEVVSGGDRGKRFEASPISVCAEKGLNDLSELPREIFEGIPDRLFEDILTIADGKFDAAAKASLDQGKFPDSEQARDFGIFCFYLIGRSRVFKRTSLKAVEQMSLDERQRKIASIFGVRALAGMIQNLPTVISNASIKVYRASDGFSFFTSDCPASVWVKSRGKLLYCPNASDRPVDFHFTQQILFCPLTPKYFLTLQAKERGGITLDTIDANLKTCRYLQEKSLRSADTWIFNFLPK